MARETPRLLLFVVQRRVNGGLRRCRPDTVACPIGAMQQRDRSPASGRGSCMGPLAAWWFDASCASTVGQQEETAGCSRRKRPTAGADAVGVIIPEGSWES